MASNPPMDDSCLMAPLQLAGRLIMENGGETYRVEETVTRMGHAFGVTEVDSFAIPSGVFISYRKQDGTVETAVKRVRKGPIDLKKVDAVNAISRRVESEHLSCEEVLACLNEIAQAKPLVSKPLQMLAVAVSSGGWAVMFGGGWFDALFATVFTFLVQIVTMLLEKFRVQSLVPTLLGSFLATLLPMLLYHFTQMGQVEMMAAGCLMPLLPGLAMTNAVQDAMRGDMVSGLSHGVSAILTAVLIASGALIATAVSALITGGVL